ncbi:MAG: beta-propeller fold lactonase family protein [Hyphomicrobium sp.]
MSACVAGAFLTHDSASAFGGEAFVTNQPADSVSVVDLATMTLSGDIKLSGKPAGIAMSADKSRAYVTAPDGKSVFEIDCVARTVARVLNLGGGPLGIAAHPTRPEIYVADWYAHKIVVISTDPAAQALAVVADIAVGQSPSGLAVTPDGRLLLSADRDSNAVSIIDIASRTRTGTVAVGERPFGITITPDGARAVTANVGSDDVSVIDIAGQAVVGRVAVGRRPYAIAFAAGRGFVTDQYAGTVTVYDAATLAVAATIEACDHPEGIAADATGKAVYVACWGDNELLEIDTAALKITRRVAVGDGPRAFGAFLR